MRPSKRRLLLTRSRSDRYMRGNTNAMNGFTGICQSSGDARQKQCYGVAGCPLLADCRRRVRSKCRHEPAPRKATSSIPSLPPIATRLGLSAPVITRVVSGWSATTWPLCIMLSVPWVTCTRRVGCAAIQLGTGILRPRLRPLSPAHAASRPRVTGCSAIAAKWILIESNPSPMENRLVLRGEPAAAALCH